MNVSPVTVVLGAQWGDEGKGKLVDLLATEMSIVARCQGGNNAGHTIMVDNITYDFHLLPSGIVQEKCMSVIGNGVVVNVPGLFEEIDINMKKGLTNCEDRLLISDRAHLVFQLHTEIDALQEKSKGEKSLGTTKKGIGPTYASKSSRCGIRVHHLMSDFDKFSEMFRSMCASYKDLWGDVLVIDVEAEIKLYKTLRDRMRPMVKDTAQFMNDAITNGHHNILVEGANAAMLDIDFGTYPYVTSSNCTVGAACVGLGIPPQRITRVHGVVKAYTTRVGDGPFPTEQLNSIGDALQVIGREYGVTTGRKRRCGWLDIVVVRYASMINGLTSIALTKLDILDSFEEIKICTGYIHKGTRLNSMPADLDQLGEVECEYITLPGWVKPGEDVSTSKIRTWEDLPVNAQNYVKKIEELSGVPVQWIGIGASRDSMIKLFD